MVLSNRLEGVTLELCPLLLLEFLGLLVVPMREQVWTARLELHLTLGQVQLGLVQVVTLELQLALEQVQLRPVQVELEPNQLVELIMGQEPFQHSFDFVDLRMALIIESMLAQQPCQLLFIEDLAEHLELEREQMLEVLLELLQELVLTEEIMLVQQPVVKLEQVLEMGQEQELVMGLGLVLGFMEQVWVTQQLSEVLVATLELTMAYQPGCLCLLQDFFSSAAHCLSSILPLQPLLTSAFNPGFISLNQQQDASRQ